MALALAVSACQSGAPAGASTSGTPAGGPFERPSASPDACPSPAETPDPSSEPDPCDLFPGAGSGTTVPATFAGKISWTWEGGDSNSIGAEHHEHFEADVRLRIDPDSAGPFEGWAQYDDAGSTWTYDGTVISTATDGCTLTITKEAHGHGNFSTNGVIVARLEDAEQAYVVGTAGMELSVDTGDIPATETQTGCGANEVIPAVAGAPSLNCDELLDGLWGVWARAPNDTITFSCTVDNVTEDGSLQGS